MAEPAQRQRPRLDRPGVDRHRVDQQAVDPQTVDAPPVDPAAIDRAYRFYRAKRHAKVEHRRATRWARVRFWAFLGLLLIACAVVGVTVWSEIARIFGI